MGKKTPHSTLTEVGSRAARALRLAGLHPYPGIINPARTRGSPRVTITFSLKRIQVAVAGQGHQELHLYGTTNREVVEAALVKEFGVENVSVRDRPHAGI